MNGIHHTDIYQGGRVKGGRKESEVKEGAEGNGRDRRKERRI